MLLTALEQIILKISYDGLPPYKSCVQPFLVMPKASATGRKPGNLVGKSILFSTQQIFGVLPVKEKNGSGTGMGTLIPTIPTSTSVWNFLAAGPLRVKIAVPLPCWLLLITSRASSKVSA